MDYQFVYFCQFSVLIILAVFLNNYVMLVVALYERDLLLTPKQGLQINGKSIYYEDDTNDALHNQSKRPWERTLKHVAYVTLFAANAGKEVERLQHNANQSTPTAHAHQQPTYAAFVRSPYVSTAHDNYARFGDIVTLATGRLISTQNGTFEFLEGLCAAPYAGCEAEQLWAFWQVQKIRHRDAQRQFRYEMKFSITPLRNYKQHHQQQPQENNKYNASTTKRKADENVYWQPAAAPSAQHQQAFIQREDDYPHSFRKLLGTQEQQFFERKHAEQRFLGYKPNAAVAVQQQRGQQATPVPQSTFMHAMFQLPPLRPEMLNTGEYLRYKPQHKSKIELYPSIYNFVNAHVLKPAMAAAAPQMPTTTYRPVSSPYRMPKPELSTRPQNEFLAGSTLRTPPATHHYHHHYYMPNSQEQNVLTEQQQLVPLPLSQTLTHRQELPPAPQKVAFPMSAEQSYGQYAYGNIVEVTPPTISATPTTTAQATHPLQKPLHYELYPQQQQLPHAYTTKEPFLIYAAPLDDVAYQVTSTTPFVQSEAFDDGIRYSEPDPLYTQAPSMQSTGYAYFAVNYEERTPKPDSIAAQLPAPEPEQDTRIPYAEEAEEQQNATETGQSQSQSQSAEPANDLQEKSSQKEIKIDVPNVANNETTTERPSQNATRESDADKEAANVTTTATVLKSSAATEQHFVSTSTTQKPLRALSRFRLPQYTRSTTTSTEQPVLKWMPKRRQSQKHADAAKDYAVSGSALAGAAANTTTDVNLVLHLPPTAATPQQQQQQQQESRVEILTQKSVSKSISIKIGDNGEEIPIIVDDQPPTDGQPVGDIGNDRDNEILDNKRKLFKHNL